MGWKNMPRGARIKSETGIYHMILRGINRQTIFEDEEDASKFIGTLKKYIKTYRSKQKYSFKIIASKLII
jgi:hypothetical protein